MVWGLGLKYAPCLLRPNYDHSIVGVKYPLHRCSCHKVEVSNFLRRSHEMFKCPMGNCLSRLHTKNLWE